MIYHEFWFDLLLTVLRFERTILMSQNPKRMGPLLNSVQTSTYNRFAKSSIKCICKKSDLNKSDCIVT